MVAKLIKDGRCHMLGCLSGPETGIQCLPYLYTQQTDSSGGWKSSYRC